MTEIRHDHVACNGVRLHVARLGEGRPLLLLHGWPEFWLAWEPVMRLLANRLYFAHFLRHWSGGNPAAFDDVLEAWVDEFLKPGNLQGGFNWYVSQNAARLRMLRGEAPKPAPIAIPTCVRWGEKDPILRVEWMDLLGAYFTNLDARPFTGVGHFPHREDPNRSATEITAFFDRVFPA